MRNFGPSVVSLVLVVGIAGSSYATDSALSLSLSTQRVVHADPKSPFHVLVTNKSSEPLKIWEDWNSWGYFAVSFEMSDNSGASWVVKKRADAIFTRNFPSFVTVPGNTHVVDVYLGDGKVWEGVPLKRGQSQTVLVRAVFEIPETNESKQYGVWTGRIESGQVEVTFVG